MVSEVESINLQSAPGQYSDLSVMPIAQKVALKKKLKTELANVRTRIEFFGGRCERALINDFPPPVKDHIISGKACSRDKDQHSMSRRRKLAELSKQQKEAGNVSYNDEGFIIEKSEAVSIVTDAFKGDSPGRFAGQNEKGLKMDIAKIKQCSTVLMTLMKHQFGWVFNQPVDPVKLNIPDYFSIIKYPMDLGTVKDKLERNCYSSTHQFAADVRLTFSNATTYNPPLNYVHMMAKDLNNIFNTRWKSLESKWRKECPISLQQSVRKITKKQAITSKQVLRRAPSCNSNSLSSKSLTVAEKLKLQNSLAKISRRNIPPRLLKFLEKACLIEQSEERINVNIDELDEGTLWELHLIVRSCGDAEPLKVSSINVIVLLLLYYYHASLRSLIPVGFASMKIIFHINTACRFNEKLKGLDEGVLQRYIGKILFALSAAFLILRANFGDIM